MRKVLHVGPCDTPGGMAKVIEILSENPPEGWAAETWQSHIDSKAGLLRPSTPIQIKEFILN